MSSSAPLGPNGERQVRLRFRDWRFRVRDILASVNAALEYADGMAFEEFARDEYFGVDDRILWDTVVHDLPPLVTKLEAVLAERG